MKNLELFGKQIEFYKVNNRSIKGLRLIDVGNRFGNMNTNTAFFPEGMSKENCKAAFLQNRCDLSHYHNDEFNPYKFYMPLQNGNGEATILTEEMVQATKDGWDLDIKSDILIVTEKTPRVVAGYPVADCPVIIASDLKNGVTATAHCSGERINQFLPKQTIESLQSNFDSRLEDIYVYIGAHAGNNWAYTCNPPAWATESFWEEVGAITQVGDKYKIDLDKALLYQLGNPGQYDSFLVNHDNTITNPNYYSNHAYKTLKREEKAGRGFQGAYYKKMR